jgi:hypothetical protein
MYKSQTLLLLVSCFVQRLLVLSTKEFCEPGLWDKITDDLEKAFRDLINIGSDVSFFSDSEYIEAIVLEIKDVPGMVEPLCETYLSEQGSGILLEEENCGKLRSGSLTCRTMQTHQLYSGYVACPYL